MGWFFMQCVIELADVVGFKRATRKLYRKKILLAFKCKDAALQLRGFLSQAAEGHRYLGNYLIHSWHCR